MDLEVNPPEGWAAEQRRERRTRALPGVSGDGERHDRFGVVVGKGVVEPRIEGRFARRVGAAMHAHPLLPEAEMAQMRSMTSSWRSPASSPRRFIYTHRLSPTLDARGTHGLPHGGL